MNDHDSLLGSWKLVAVVQDDRELDYCDIGTLYEFTETHFRHFKSRTEYEYDLYPDQSPKAIDHFISRPDNMVVKGIYELTDGELRMLFHGRDHHIRPTSMTGIRDDPYLSIHVYKRSKWKPPKRKKTKPLETLAPGSVIPKAFLDPKSKP